MKEPWAAADNPMRDIFLAITAWAAKYESDRKSQNTKIGRPRPSPRVPNWADQRGEGTIRISHAASRLPFEVCGQGGAEIFCQGQIMVRQKLWRFPEFVKVAKRPGKERNDFRRARITSNSLERNRQQVKV